jgi:putative ABC transport system permease protein
LKRGSRRARANPQSGEALLREVTTRIRVAPDARRGRARKGRRMSAAFRKSITDLTRRRARTFFTVATLALAVASLSVFALAPLVERRMHDEVRASRLPDVTLTMRPLELGDAELAALAHAPGVTALEARSAFPTRVYVGERRAAALVIGVPRFVGQRVDVVTVAAGRAPASGEVLTDVQNRRTGTLGAGTGDAIRVLAADGSTRALRVSGEGRNLDGGQEVLGEGVIVFYASPATVAALSGARGYSRLAVRLARPDEGRATVEALRARLASVPGFSGFSDLPEVRARGDWPGRADLEAFSDLLSIITVLALLAALVLVANTMTTLVGEQAGEIATMKAVGARRRDVAAIYLRTALLLGGLGTVAGTVLGLALANALAAFFGSEFFGVDARFGVVVEVLAASAVLGLAGPPLAALPAIRRAVRLPVAAALSASAAEGGLGRLDSALRRARRLPRSAQIGLRAVARRKRRALATVVQVALAVGTLLALTGLGTGVSRTVQASWSDHGWNIWLGSGRELDADAERLIRTTPGVAAAEPMLDNVADVRGHEASLWGVQARTRLRYRLAEGRWYTAAEERARAPVAVAEANLARAAGIRVGDRLRVGTATGPATLRVIGISANQQEEGTAVFVPLSTLRAVLRSTGGARDYWIVTRSADHGLIDRTTTALEERLRAAGHSAIATEVTYVAAREEEADYRTITTTIAVLGLLIVAIGMAGLANALTMSVLERTREIGILRCVGARARDVRRIYAAEGVALVLAGWTLGIPVGYAIERALVRAIREIMNVEAQFAFPAAHLWLALAGTLVLAGAVMLAPVRRAARLVPGDALRHT